MRAVGPVEAVEPAFPRRVPSPADAARDQPGTRWVARGLTRERQPVPYVVVLESLGAPPPGRKCQPTPPRPGSCPHTRPYPGVRPITPPPRAVNRAYDGVARQARAIISARKLIIDDVRARTRGAGGAPQAPLLPLPVINGSCGAGCGGAAAGRTRKGRHKRNVGRHGHGEHPTPEITKCRHTSPRRLRRPRFFDARQRTGDPPAYAGAQGSTRRGGGTRRQRNLMPSGDSSQLFLLFLSPAPDKFWFED